MEAGALFFFSCFTSPVTWAVLLAPCVFLLSKHSTASVATTNRWALLGGVIFVSEVLLLLAFAVAAISLHAGEAGSVSGMEYMGSGLTPVDATEGRFSGYATTLLAAAVHSYICSARPRASTCSSTVIVVALITVFLCRDGLHELLGGVVCHCSTGNLVMLHGLHLIGALGLTGYYLLSTDTKTNLH